MKLTFNIQKTAFDEFVHNFHAIKHVVMFN